MGHPEFWGGLRRTGNGKGKSAIGRKVRAVWVDDILSGSLRLRSGQALRLPLRQAQGPLRMTGWGLMKDFRRYPSLISNCDYSGALAPSIELALPAHDIDGALEGVAVNSSADGYRITGVCFDDNMLFVDRAIERS